MIKYSFCAAGRQKGLVADGSRCLQFYIIIHAHAHIHTPSYTWHLCMLSDQTHTLHTSVTWLPESKSTPKHNFFTHTCFRMTHTHLFSPIHCSSLSGEVISLSSMKDEEGENVIFSFKHLFSAHWVWKGSEAEVLKFGWLMHIKYQSRSHGYL